MELPADMPTASPALVHSAGLAVGGALRRASAFSSGLAALLVAGCASTTVTLEPSPQATVCAPSQAALVLWAPGWRPDQKDVAARQEAAASGLQAFLGSSGCFARSELRRVADLSAPAAGEQWGRSGGAFTRMVGIEVRELGPVVKLFSSPALVDGGTEVVLRVIEYAPPAVAPQRQFTVHWKNGGAGVVKGVSSLPGDMQAALAAGLQPAAAGR